MVLRYANNIFMKKIFLYFFFFILFIPLYVDAAQSQVSIIDDGAITVKNAKVMQLAGPTIFARLVWGDAYVRITVKTNTDTKIKTAYGMTILPGDIKEGDFISFSGALESGSDSLTAVAKSITDNTNKNEAKTGSQLSPYSGNVVSVDNGVTMSVLSGVYGKILVTFATNTEVIKGNIRTVGTTGSVRVGDRVTSMNGVFNHDTSTLVPQTVVIYVNKSLFIPQNFSGKLVAKNTTGATPSLDIASGGKTYTVYYTGNTTILNNKKSSTTLDRFLVGDSIRFFGTLREEVDAHNVDAEVIRNTSI